MKILLALIILSSGFQAMAQEPVSCGVEGRFFFKCRASNECAESMARMNCEDQGRVARILSRRDQKVKASYNEFGELVGSHCLVTLQYDCI